jgi:hypothetical protein
MSALPLEADITQRIEHVREVPLAGITDLRIVGLAQAFFAALIATVHAQKL